MAIEITMPRLSDTMEQGTLNKWRVAVGDKVHSGDLLADIETDKATMELQSFDDGTVAKLAVEEGQPANVGDLILLLAEDGESVDDAVSSYTPTESAEAPATAETPTEQPTAEPEPTPAPAATPTPTPAPAPVAPTTSTGRVRVSPLAAKLAEEHGIDLNILTGSGPDGRIIKRDIEQAIASPPAASAVAPTPAAAPPKPILPPISLEAKTTTLTNMRQTIAKVLVHSKRTIPHFTVSMTIDAEPLTNLRVQLNQILAEQGIKLSVNDLIVRGTSLAILRHPNANATFTDTAIEQLGQVNIGIAVALPEDKGGGLVVPTLRDTPNMSLQLINSETKKLAKKARTTGLTLEEMDGGTFTISNLGMYGVDHFEAIINPPQAAILAVGGTMDRPVVKDGQVVPGQEMTLTLSADHRVIDGANAAEFLQTLKKLLENPAGMLI